MGQVETGRHRSRAGSAATIICRDSAWARHAAGTEEDAAVANDASAASKQEENHASPAPPVEGEAFEVAADPGATHRLIKWRALPNGHREAITSRDGPDRGSFARRRVRLTLFEIDCATTRFRILGEGATAEEARRAGGQPAPMGPARAESLTRVVIDLVCSKPRPRPGNGTGG